MKGAVKPAPVPAESTSSKAQGKKAALTAAEVMKSKSLDDSAKFEVFKSMVTEGKISNKEVVNSVLHLVRTVLKIPNFLFKVGFFQHFYLFQQAREL